MDKTLKKQDKILFFLVFLQISAFAADTVGFKPIALLDSAPAFESPIDCAPPRLWKTPLRLQGPITALRLDFCFDSAIVNGPQAWNRNEPFNGITVTALVLDDNGRSPGGNPLIWNFKLMPESSGWKLIFRVLNASAESAQILAEKELGPVKPQTAYCLEVLHNLGADSVLDFIEFRLNGEAKGRVDAGPMKLRAGPFFWQAGSRWLNYRVKGSLFLSRMAVGGDWPGHPPKRPVIPESSPSFARNDTIKLFSPDYSPFLVLAPHSMTRYQVSADSADFALPLYDSDTTRLGLDSIAVRLRLDTKTAHFWRVRHYSGPDNASDWSRPARLPVKAPTSPPVIRILEAYYSLPGENRPERILVPEKWYDLAIRFGANGDITGLGYLLFWANAPEYPFGNLSTKGGLFLPAANYIYNLSHGEDVIFEKYVPNAYTNRMLDTVHGLYCDPSNHGYVVDDRNGRARLRVRFLKEAKRGQWSLRGVAWNGVYSPSELFYAGFEIRDETETLGVSAVFKLTAVVAGFLVLCALLFMGLKRQRAASAVLKKRYEKTVQDFTQYARANISRNLLPEDIEKNMGMSYGALHNAVKTVTGTGIKNYIIKLRIEKAKELLQSTDKNVTEVMFECGFNDLSYFTRTFRKIVGQNPKKFQSGG